ncbi:unnamed protein product [Pedinophyceae sp. YPF-701]|nr:unnamed protein product [Pedinophyceae sp. YPF-701]
MPFVTAKDGCKIHYMTFDYEHRWSELRPDYSDDEDDEAPEETDGLLSSGDVQVGRSQRGKDGARTRERSPAVDSDAETSAPVTDRNDHAVEARVVFIAGLAASWRMWWEPQMRMLFDERLRLSGIPPVRVLVLDNRGIGRSEAPTDKSRYSIETMADDVLRCMDAAGFPTAHVVGHSMGALIATKLAAAAPMRLDSLLLLAPTTSVWGSLPTLKMVYLALKLQFAKTPEDRAKLDLQCHFSPAFLEEEVSVAWRGTGCRAEEKKGGPTRPRKEALLERYVQEHKMFGMQPDHGNAGQVNAVFGFSVTRQDLGNIRSSPAPKMVVVGREDIITRPSSGLRLATWLDCPALIVSGAHFMSVENMLDVNYALFDLLRRVHEPHWVRELEAEQPDIKEAAQKAAMRVASQSQLAGSAAEKPLSPLPSPKRVFSPNTM